MAFNFTEDITILGDTTFEQSETFTITLFQPSGVTNADYTIGSPSEMTITIEDNDPQPPPVASFSTAAITIDENARGFDVTVNFSAGSAIPTRKNLSVRSRNGTASAGSDYEVINSTLFITGNGSAFTKNIRGSILDDSVYEGDETFTITLSHGSSTSNADFTIGTPSTIIVTIRENERASTDATLSALVLSTGTLSPVFAAATLTYSANVASNIANVKVTPTASHAGATITVAGTAVASGEASGDVALTAGSTTAIAVVVTAQDGSTTRNYRINVARAALLPPELSFASSTMSVTETDANQTIRITVNLSAGKPFFKSFGATATDGTAKSGSDYRTSGSFYSISSDGPAKTGTIRDLVIVGDDVHEQDENLHTHTQTRARLK